MAMSDDRDQPGAGAEEGLSARCILAAAIVAAVVTGVCYGLFSWLNPWVHAFVFAVAFLVMTKLGPRLACKD